MTPKLSKALFCLAAILMSVVGAFPHRLHVFSLVLFSTGFVAFIMAILLSGAFRLHSALWLLFISNLSFWISVALWYLARRSFLPETEGGIDEFAGTVAFWGIVFLSFLLYESAIFVRNAVLNRQRGLALVGLAAALLQIPTTLTYIWRLAQGV